MERVYLAFSHYVRLGRFRLRGRSRTSAGEVHARNNVWAMPRGGRNWGEPHADAPPFRSFGENKLYDSDFRQRLQDGLSTIHRDMPTFRFSRRDADAAVNYLRSIQHSQKSKP